ncbi:MAG: hypothetical protein HYX47_10410 [Burkholderiales bacterium]|nr:hypothetical protein [Burkholderiales bacterium]
MANLDYFVMRRREQEYTDRAPDPARTCGGCDRLTKKTQWDRCDKGGFFVRVAGGCKCFTPKPEETSNA